MNWELIIGVIIILNFWIGLAMLFKYMGFMKDERELLKEKRVSMSKKLGAEVEHRLTGVSAICDEDMIVDENWELA